MKFINLTMLACAVCLSSCISENKLKLSAPEAPFKKTMEEQETETLKPIAKGNSIIFGNKKLDISSNGRMKLYADGRLLADINYYFRLTEKDKKTKHWFKPGSERLWRNNKTFFDASKSNFTHKGNTFAYKGIIPMTGGEGWFKQTVTLEDNGLIEIRQKWGITGTPEEELVSSASWISMPQISTAGGSIIVNGKKFPIPQKTKYGFISLWKPKNFVITVLPESKAKSFKIDTKVCKELIAWQHPDGKTVLRIYDNKKLKETAYNLDLREGLKAGGVSPVFAGIDFKAIENMELPDYGSSKNLMLNPSFEKGFLNLFCKGSYMGRMYGEKVWTSKPYEIDNQVAKFGNNSLKIKTFYKKFSDNRSLSFPGSLTTWAVPVSAGTYTMSFYAKGNQPGKQKIKIWLPKTTWVGNIHTYLKNGLTNIIPTNDWKRYSLTFKAPKNMLICANISAVSSSGKGYVWLDGFQLEPGSKATAFESRPAEGQLLTSDENNFLQVGDKINGHLKITATPNAFGAAKVTVKDFFEQELYSGNFKFKCNDKGVADIMLPFEGKFPKGVFVAKVDYNFSDGKKCHEFFRFSIMDFLENKHRLKDLFSDSYGTPEKRSDFLQVLDRWKKIGIGSKGHVKYREKEVWDTYRKFGVAPLDTFMVSDIRPYKNGTSKLLGFALLQDGIANRGMKPDDPRILLRDYHFDANGEPTPEYLNKLKNAVAEIARKNPWVPMWAFGGEFIARFPYSWWSKEGTEEQAMVNYSKILKAFCEGIKEGNPKAKTFQDDPCNMRPEGGIAETGQLLAATNKINCPKFDMIGIHPYRKTPESPDLDADIKLLLDVIGEKGYDNTPVFFPEGMHYGPYNIPQWGIESARWLPPACWYAGPLSYDMGWTEKISAAWRARSWLVALKYQDRVKAFTSSSDVNNFDMDMYLTPFASQKIPNTLGHILGDAYFKKDIRFAPYIRCYIFEDAQKRPVAAVWCHHPQLDAGVMEAPSASVNLSGEMPKIFDLMGNEKVPETDANGNILFPVSSFPIFFRGSPNTLPTFVRAFDNAALVSGVGMSPMIITGKPVSVDKLAVSVKNFLSKPFNGTIKTGDKASSPLHVPASEKTEVIAEMPEKLRADKIVGEYLPVFIQSGKSKFNNDISFRGFACKKAKAPISIDGKIEDWKNIPAININNRLMRKDLKKISNSDFSGWFKSAWNQKGIYLCVKITDDKFVHEEFEQTGRRWNNDSLQIYFDTVCDARSKQQRGYDRNDYDYAVFPNADAQSSIVYRFLSPDPQITLGTQTPPDKTIAEDIPSAFKRTKDGYVYEVFFPAKYLLPVKLKKGYSIGFGMFVNDRDNGSRTKSALTLAPAGKGCYAKPHLWPIMLLAD